MASKHNGRRSAERSTQIDQRLSDLQSTWDGRPMSMQEIADQVGVSKACIQQIEMKAIKTMRDRLQPVIKEWQG